MHDEKLQCYVLSTLDYGDSDRIVSLFTLEHGRIKAFARGARKSRRRFGAALETFARVEALVRLKDGLSGLRQAEVISIYPNIRRDLARIAHALYACELVELLTPEGHPLPRLYRLLTAYLDRLESEPATESERRFFEINLLNILGYRPALETCSRCDTPFGERDAFLRSGGEISCRECGSGGRILTSATRRTLISCLNTARFGLIAFSAETLSQAGDLLDESLAVHAGKRIKSQEFLRQSGP